MNRPTADWRGRRAEALACWHLRLRGWRILARRVKTARGEVDIVARRWRTVAFVEVKWRSTSQGLDGAIDESRLRRVAAAAQILAPRFARDTDDQRVDVLLLAPGHFPRHIVNAWMP